jgi:hypothetical protein
MAKQQHHHNDGEKEADPTAKIEGVGQKGCQE